MQTNLLNHYDQCKLYFLKKELILMGKLYEERKSFYLSSIFLNLLPKFEQSCLLRLFQSGGCQASKRKYPRCHHDVPEM